MDKFTPEPWEIQRRPDDDLDIVGDVRHGPGEARVMRVIARVHGQEITTTTMGNARMIVAAPKLLSALVRLAQAVELANALTGPLGKEFVRGAYAAIALAEGTK